MSARATLLQELETSIRAGSPNQRITTLRRVTDLFIRGAEQYDDEQVKLFDEVIGRLAAEIEKTALAELAHRLAPIASAPRGVIRRLASDQRIAVAGPVLEGSARLTEIDLIEFARDKGQEHLLAMCGRSYLSEAVTDVLVDRGNSDVARKVTVNDGARFSEAGFANLVARAEADDELAEKVGKRIDIPPHLFQKLVERATEQVQRRLLAGAKPEMQVAIQHILSEISRKAAGKPELGSRSYSAARSFVNVLAESGRLSVNGLQNFASSGRFEEAVAALAELSAVPLDIVDRVMHGDCLDPFLVLCKAKGFDWSLVRALILVRRSCRKLSPQELAQACQDFDMLSRSTADRVLRFWQIRQTG
jgi:uncharacterized protein (DUF2336 family)